MTAVTCLDAAQLDDLAAERVPETLAGRLRSHVESCAECRARFAECRRNQEYFNDMAHILRNEDCGLRIEGDAAPLGLIPNPKSETCNDIPGYQLIREIHRGGQGVVYEAVQHSTKRTVALKRLLGGVAAGQRARWRFEREVKLIAALRHPNIVVIHDSGISQGGYYFAMDYVRGQPLDTHVRLAAPPLRDLIRLFRQICDAVAYAHRRGVIHRDLKPSNILINEAGTPFILDFGLAKVTGDDLQESQAPAVSVAGHLMGTMRYMSPEQTLGRPDAIDIRADVYSLGVILYELLTGSPPYPTTADLAACFRSIREADPPRPSRIRREINSDLETIVLKALAKEPERRYQSAGELGEDLTAWMEGRPIAARSASSLYVLRKLAVRHSFESLALLSVLATLVGLGAIEVSRGRDARADAAELRRRQSELQASHAALMSERDRVRAALPRHALGWFIAEWEAGRIGRARELLQEVPAGTPERAVMNFLLEESAAPGALRDYLNKDHSALAHFAVGLRSRRDGRLTEAQEAFRSSLEATGGEWIKSAARARLDDAHRQNRTEEKEPRT